MFSTKTQISLVFLLFILFNIGVIYPVSPSTKIALKDEGSPGPQRLPENAYVIKDQWYCKNGYKKVGNSCEPISVPANAYSIKDQWYCNNGYKKVGNSCEPISVPANASAIKDQWYCNNGYKKVGNSCVSIFGN